jgi:hypothetical protein
LLDYEIKAPGQLLQRLDVRTLFPDAHIITIDVSSSGEYIAILSAKQHMAYINIWDMEAVLHPTATGATEDRESHSHFRSNPRATISIPLRNGDYDIMRLVRIALSSDGLGVVLYQQSHTDDVAPGKARSGLSRFPFRYFRVKETYHIAKDLEKSSPIHELELIEDTSTHLSKDQFVGYGKFMSRDAFGTSSQVSGGNIRGAKGEYFVTCTESRIAVYDVDSGFKPLYGISIGGLYSMKSRDNQLRILYQCLQGSAFLWLEDLQNVSIWDIVSGANMTYISIHNPHSQSQDEIEYIAVSPGGKLMALGGKNWIRTYFMDSGIEISSKVIHEGEILNIAFLDHDKTLVVTIGKPPMEQISLIMDAINLSSWSSTAVTFPSSSYSIQHIVQRPGIAETQEMGCVMIGVNYDVLEVFTIPQPGVPIPRSQMIGCKDDCVATDYQELNKHKYRHPGSHLQYQLVVDFEEKEIGNRRCKVTRVQLYSVDELDQKQNVITIVPEPWRLYNTKGENTRVNASFVDFWPRFIITTPLGFQVWNLPCLSPDNRCEISLSWVKPCSEDASINDEVCSYAQEILKTRVCMHGECVETTWFDIRTNCTKSECVQIPKSNWISRTETLYCINSIPVLASCYTDSSTAAKEAIVRYIVRHINHDPLEGTIDDSVMTKIARSARWECCSDILSPILGSTDIKWIPRLSINPRHTRTRVSVNPIALLVKDAKSVPQSLPMAELVMDYCIRQAKSQCEVGFIVPVMSCLRKLADHHPEIAIDITRRTVFIPVKNPEFLVNHSILARPMWRPIWDMIMRQSGAIYEYPDPAFQLRSQLLKIRARDISTHIEVSKELVVDPMNKSFKRPLYVAPYSLLWHHTDDEAIVQPSMDVSARPNHVETIVTMLRTMLSPWSKPGALANFSNLSYFDNPAVEALIKYKW